MGLLNEIYGFVQARRFLFNITCDDKFEQSERIGTCSASSMMER